MNIDTKRDEQIVVYSFDGILSNQTEQSDNTCNSMNQSYGLYTEWKNQDPEEYILFNEIQKQVNWISMTEIGKWLPKRRKSF